MELRERVASQVPHVKHWRVHEGNYDIEPANTWCTWFVDPPYEHAGRHYRHGSADLNYAQLGEWCQALRGHRIVCEHPSATWLPFRSLGAVKSGPRSRKAMEAVWP